jgi:hypothetical protein
MPVLFSNNATSPLASSITASATTITLTTGNGSLFPSVPAGSYFYATLADSSGNYEVIKVTARSGDVLTAVRAQEGTTGRAFLATDKLELRVTAAGLGNMVQLDGSQTITGSHTFTGTTTFSGSTVLTGGSFSGSYSGSPTFTGTPAFTALTATSATFTSATINGGTITGITDLAIADGGTGASTAADARASLGTVADTATNGIAARTAANTLTARTITAGTGITVVDGDGVSGNPTVSNSGVTSVDSQTGAVTLSSLTAFTKSLSSNGYQKLPGGLTIQWGTYNSTTDGGQAFSWPVAFAASCYVAVGTFNDLVNYPLPIISVSTTGFTVDRNSNISGTAPFRVIAIGS